MPAGTDLIPWSPRVGTSGDDRYDPGESRIDAGDTGGYSSTPALGEVATGAKLNQVASEIKRRGGTVSYATAETVYKASLWASYKSAINAIRISEGKGAFTWSADYSAGRRITRLHLLELRKALATDSLVVYPYLDYPTLGFSYYTQIYKSGSSTYPPSTVLLGLASSQVGQSRNPTPSFSYNIYRAPFFFSIPAGIPTLSSAQFAFGYSYGSTRVWTLKLYRASSYYGALDTGDWGNLDVLEDSASNSSLSTSPGTSASPNVSLFTVSTVGIVAGSGVAYTFVSSDDESGHVPADHPNYEYDQMLPPEGGTAFRPHLRLFT